MKTTIVFTGLILALFLSACTVDELEFNNSQINLETIDVSEYKNSEIPKDTIFDRTGEGEPPKD